MHTVERRGVPDWRELSSFIHGVSPELQVAAKPNSYIDPMVETWNKKKVELRKYS